MSDGGRRADPGLGPAEQRLVRLLALLRVEPGDSQGLTSEVMRTARWQLVVRDLAGALGGIAAAIGSGIGVLLGGDFRKGRG